MMIKVKGGKIMIENFKLYNGVEIPAIGFGTWQIPDGEEAFTNVVPAI